MSCGLHACRYGPPGSAICVYSADMTDQKDKGIFTVFSEEYHNLRPQNPPVCNVTNIPNDNPFTVSVYYICIFNVCRIYLMYFIS